MLDVRLSSKFEPLFKGGYSYYGFYGGRGSGKSHGVAEYAIMCALQRHERIFTARQFKNSLDKSAKALYEDKIKKFGVSHLFKIRDQWIECIPTGSLFQFVGLERNTDSVRSLEGATLTILEEAQTLSAKAIDVIEATVMRDKRSRMVYNWNPINKDDAVDKKFRGGVIGDDTYATEMNWRDNPYFDETNLRSQMERMKKINPSKYKHIWEGEYFGGAERRVFNDFEIADIEVPDGIFPQYGLDFGSRDPNAIVKLYVNEREKWIYIAREFKGAGTTDIVLQGLNKVVERKTDKIVCDSAWPQSIAVVQKEYPNAVGAKKGQNSVLAGIQWLQGYKIYISPSCPQMQEEAENYSWQFDKHQVNDDGSPKSLGIPEDDNNHLWDAVRYGTEQNRLEKRGRIGVVRFTI